MEKQPLDDLTMKEALDFPIRNVMHEHPELSYSQAKKLVLNTLQYNLVINQICEQTDFLLGVLED